MHDKYWDSTSFILFQTGVTLITQMPEPFFPLNIIDHISQAAAIADREIRADLILGYIANENDYSSNLTASIRRIINGFHFPGLSATSYVLQDSVERKVGCDVAIILENASALKVCLFEAKFPRFKTHKNYWDSIQKSTGNSHFHEQILKQSNWSSVFSIWEMIYCEYPYKQQPSYYPDFFSSCIWHEDAYQAAITRPNPKIEWNDTELQQLMQKNGLTIDEMIKITCSCKSGMKLPKEKYHQMFIDYGVPSEVLVINYAETVRKSFFG